MCRAAPKSHVQVGARRLHADPVGSLLTLVTSVGWRGRFETHEFALRLLWGGSAAAPRSVLPAHPLGKYTVFDGRAWSVSGCFINPRPRGLVLTTSTRCHCRGSPSPSSRVPHVPHVPRVRGSLLLLGPPPQASALWDYVAWDRGAMSGALVGSSHESAFHSARPRHNYFQIPSP